MSFYYSYHGQIIESEFPLALRWRADPCYDPAIKIYSGDPYLPDPQQAETYFCTNNEVRIVTPDLRSTIAENGKKILISTAESCDAARLYGALVMDILPLAFFFQGAVQIHASGVAYGGYGICFLGPSGAGKSLAAARYVNRGYSLLDDDRILVRREQDVVALYGDHLSVCANSDASNIVDLAGWVLKGSNEKGKAVFSPPKDRSVKRAYLSLLVLLEEDLDSKVEEVSLAKCFPKFMDCLQLSHLVAMKYGEHLLDTIEALFGQVPVVRCARAVGLRDCYPLECLHSFLPAHYYFS